MKNLMIYTNPNKAFDEETATLIKLQIDNSLALGWKREDILLFTNFEYEYDGVKAQIVPGYYCDFDYTSNKILVIKHLLEFGLLEDTLYWYHDFDAYQDGDINESDFENSKDFALCSYGYKNEWQLGSFFFRLGALDIFRKLSVYMMERPRSRADEKTFKKLITKGMITQEDFTELNLTYNLTQKFVHRTYSVAYKPVKVLHFHPGFKDDSMAHNATEIFMYGKNKLEYILLSPRLIHLFNTYGIK